jgi:hypothetical protein
MCPRCIGIKAYWAHCKYAHEPIPPTETTLLRRDDEGERYAAYTLADRDAANMHKSYRRGDAD